MKQKVYLVCEIYYREDAYNVIFASLSKEVAESFLKSENTRLENIRTNGFFNLYIEELELS